MSITNIMTLMGFRFSIVLITFVFWLFLTTLAYAQPTAAALQKSIELHNQYTASFQLPRPNEQQIETLLQGNVVKVIDRPEGKNSPQRAVGLILVHQDIRTVWIATRDPHFIAQESTIEKRLAQPHPTKEIWYGYMKLPWPAQDRQWLIHLQINQPMAHKTNNQIWERSWQVSPKAKQEAQSYWRQKKLPDVPNFHQALHLPRNRGSWFMLAHGDKTILGYQCSTIIGGNIPSSLVNQFVFRSLDGMLKEMRHRAEKVIPKHYIRSHPTIRGADNQEIAFF